MMKGEIQTELDRRLKEIHEKTGVEVRLAPTGGDETKFSLAYCGTETDAYLDGTGAQAEACARLVSYLLAGDCAQVTPDRDDYLKSILLGEGNKTYAFRFLTKYNLTDGACYALDIVPERRLSEALLHIENCLEGGFDLVIGMDSSRIAVVKFSDDMQSPVEFGQFLYQSLYEELGIKTSIGIGSEVKTFSDISVSYAQAMTAVRMSGIFRSKNEVHSYREYLLVKMLEDIPEGRLKEYMDQLQIGNAEDILSDEEMTETAEEFLENSLNVSETSRNLFMHRNTLMYRLDKIERATGLNIRNFSDAVTFRVITILYKLSQS